MAREDRNLPEFKNYRQALAVTFVAVGALGVVLIASSIVAELFFPRGERTPPPSPADLLECNGDVRKLLVDLGEQAAALQRDAATGAAGDLAVRWEQFSRAWQKEWDLVDTRCGFDRLADTGYGSAYDRMAWVHRTLATTNLKFRELMAAFQEDVADDLAEMRQALDKSMADLEKRTGSQPTE